MPRRLGKSVLLWSLLVHGCFPLLGAPSLAWAQGAGEYIGAESSVGYIDSAIPASVLRLRFDADYNLNRASRAEFFYARTGPLGPGLPKAESRIDDQQLSAY